MSKKQTCFCSYCRNERVYSAKKHIQLLDIVFLLIPSVLLSFIFWQKLDPRLLYFWAILGGFTEIWIMLQWRVNVVCQFCGFDPVVYLRNPAEAAEKVKNFMNDRKQTATFLLSSKQFEKIPRRKIPKPVFNSKNTSANT
jgi:hypothetical protein